MATSFFQDKISECKHNAELIFQQHPNISSLSFTFKNIERSVFESGRELHNISSHSALEFKEFSACYADISGQSFFVHFYPEK